MSGALHPAAPHHLPGFITAPGQNDVLMIAVGILLLVAVLAVGNFYLHLHTLPERLAHRTHKLQFEIVAVLGLLALFTHNHLFWVIGLMLALIDLPDFLSPLRRIAGSVERIADNPPVVAAHVIAAPAPAPIAPKSESPVKIEPPATPPEPPAAKPDPAIREVPSHA